MSALNEVVSDERAKEIRKYYDGSFGKGIDPHVNILLKDRTSRKKEHEKILKRYYKAMEKLAYQRAHEIRDEWYRRWKSGDWEWLKDSDFPDCPED